MLSMKYYKNEDDELIGADTEASVMKTDYDFERR